MRTRLFLLKSILSRKDNAVLRNNHIKEPILKVAEEVGAWLLAAGVLLGIYWIAEILLKGHLG